MIAPDPTADTNTPPPILPAHLEETIGSIILRLHAVHHRYATLLQRGVDRMTALFGRPGFIDVLTVIVVAWMSLNLLAAALGYRPIDPPPFSGLGGAVSWVSLCMVVLILATQHREHLILQLALSGEQKTAKVIELLEEFRQDNPLIRNRVDQEAEDMAQLADPQRVLDSPKIIPMSCL